MPHVTAVNPGLGTLLKATIGSTLTTISQRVKINGPAMEVGKAETTHLDSTTKTYRPTLADGGTLSLEIWYDPQDATHLFLLGLLTPPLAAITWNLVTVDVGPTTFSFSAFLTKFEVTGMEEEGNLSANIELQINGIPTHTP